jgi:hypothetical protein
VGPTNGRAGPSVAGGVVGFGARRLSRTKKNPPAVRHKAFSSNPGQTLAAVPQSARERIPSRPSPSRTSHLSHRRQFAHLCSSPSAPLPPPCPSLDRRRGRRAARPTSGTGHRRGQGAAQPVSAGTTREGSAEPPLHLCSPQSLPCCSSPIPSLHSKSSEPAASVSSLAARVLPPARLSRAAIIDQICRD